MSCNSNLSKKEVSIPYELYQSKEGRYFIGQTPLLNGSNKFTFASLINPSISNVNIYLNAMTITNTSGVSLSAEFYLKSSFINGLISNKVSATNLSIYPTPTPNGQIQYIGPNSQITTAGTSIFSRIVSPFSTEVVDGGQIILPPGKSIMVYIGGFLPVTFDNTIIAFGWWEEKIYNSCPCDC